MAWISAGTNNEELVAQLIENRVINSTKLQIAFKYTDRGDFVQPEFKSQAYLDRPFKQRYVHISAPHMYVTILEEMELKNGLSFLNIGSGSGYLSCLASCLLGDSGLTHGIDVSPEVVKHSELCCEKWFAHILKRREEGETDAPVISKEGVSFVCGNCFNIDIEKAISSCRYDRIYVGAGCPEARKEFFLSLLADDGIMIASINEKNELIKINKTHRNVYKESHISQVIFAPLIEPTEETYELRQSPRSRLNTMTSVNSGYTSTEEQNTTSASGFNSIHSSPHISSSSSSSSTWHTVNNNISDVYNGSSSSCNNNPSSTYSLLSLSSSPMSNSVITFSISPSLTLPLMTLAALPNTRTKKVILPPLLWAPTASRHRQFSRVFKNAVFTILLVSRHPRTAMVAVKVKGPTGGDWVVMKPCVCGTLPHPIWMYILTFTTRDWFVPRLTAYQMIQDELVVERALREAAEQRIQDEVVKRIRAERERDMYRMVVRRMSRESEVTAATDSSNSGSNGVHGDGNHTVIHDDDDDDGEEDDNNDEEETVVEEDEGGNNDDNDNDDDGINDSDEDDNDDEDDDHANMITTMGMVTDDEEIAPGVVSVAIATTTVPALTFAAVDDADSPKTTSHIADDDEISAVASDDEDDDNVSIESDGNGDNVDFNDSKYHIDGNDIRTVFDHNDDDEEEEDEQLYYDCQQQQQQVDGNCNGNMSTSVANQNAVHINDDNHHDARNSNNNDSDNNMHINTTNAAGHRRKRSIVHSFEHIDFDSQSQSQSQSNSTTSGDNNNTSKSSSNNDVDLLSPFPVLEEDDAENSGHDIDNDNAMSINSISMNVCTGDNEVIGSTVVMVCGVDNSITSDTGNYILRVSSVSGSVSMSDFTSSGLSTETEEATAATGDSSIVADKVKKNGSGNGHIAMNNHSSSSSASSSSSSSMSVVHVAKKVANMLTPTSSFRN